MSERFVVAEQIEVLSRRERRIIFNAAQINPAYFASGGDQVLRILEELRQKGPFTSAHLPEACSPEVLQFLCAHSLVLPQEHAEIITRSPCRQCTPASGNAPARSIYLLLTHSCNQACIYCLNGKESYQKKQHLMMSETVARKALEQTLQSISHGGRLEVVFFGGEPLLNWALAKRIIAFCEDELAQRHPDKTIVYHLTTNLTLFPEDLIDVAKDHNITFLVDIDGPEDIHNTTRPFVDGRGSFRTSAKNLERLADAGIRAGLRATVTSHNDSRLMEVTRVHKNLGGAGSAFVPLNPVDSDINLLGMDLCPSPEKLADGLREIFHSGIWPVEDLYPFNEYLDRLRPSYKNIWGCGAPFGNTPVVTSTGKMYSCIYLVGNERYEVGDVGKNDFPRQDVVAQMLDSVNINNRKDCQNCGFRYLCGGGCPVGIFSIFSNPLASEELRRYAHAISCTVSRTVLDELIWSMADQINLPVRQANDQSVPQF